jgi:hypothetical protein
VHRYQHSLCTDGVTLKTGIRTHNLEKWLVRVCSRRLADFRTTTAAPSASSKSAADSIPTCAAEPTSATWQSFRDQYTKILHGCPRVPGQSGKWIVLVCTYVWGETFIHIFVQSQLQLWCWRIWALSVLWRKKRVRKRTKLLVVLNGRCNLRS